MVRFSEGNAANHAAGLGQRKCSDDFAGAMGNIVCGEEGVAQVGHGHDKIVGKPRDIGVVAGKEGDDDSKGGEDGSI